MKKINSICIIDDDPITIFGIRKILTTLDVCDQIVTYENGKVAIDGIKDRISKGERMPEIIFLDINMPIMDGWQFLEEFIQLPIKEKIRINIVTSSIDPYDKKQSEFYKLQTHHIIAYKNKPVSKTDIAEITKAA
ncbi:response regulator [Spongiimicrobium salis]|uniref:response regulator n=1 Tax=Spongiimicrobium salis TaxID=1667022 RepID=UPI00374D3AF1